MMNPSNWARLGVQDFFNGFNWTGETPKLSFTPVTEDSETEIETLTEHDWFSLTLQDVLNRGNWHGMSVYRSRQSASVQSNPAVTFDPLLSLTLPVQTFFGGIPWRGNGVIPTVAPVSPKKKNHLLESIPESSDDWTITDLSDLL